MLASLQVVPATWVADAVAEGTRAKEPMLYVSRTSRSPYTVFLRGPYARVASFAAKAAAKFQPVPEIPPELLEPYLEVAVLTNRPYDIRHPYPPATHVVLKLAGGEPIQPLAIQTHPEAWSNAFGATVTGQGLTAKFPLVNEPGDLEIVIVIPNGSRTHTIKAKDRAKIR